MLSRKAILIAGMHRSGTSAVTRLVSLLGASLPDDLMPAGPDNPRGYWEPTEVVALHDAALAALGSCWDDLRPIDEQSMPSDRRTALAAEIVRWWRRTFEGAPLAMVKDPRLPRFLATWLEALAEVPVEPVVIVPTRAVAHVAASLHRRDGLEPGAGALLWLSHVVAAERSSRGAARGFVDYDRLVAGWRGEIQRLEAQTGLRFPARTPITEGEVDGFLAPELNRSAAEAVPVPPGVLADWTGKVTAALDRLQVDPRDATAQGMIDEVTAALAAAGPLIGSLAGTRALDLARGRERERKLHVEIANRDAVIADVSARLQIRHADLDRLAFELENARRIEAEFVATRAYKAWVRVRRVEDGVRAVLPEHLAGPDPDLETLRASRLFASGWYVRRYWRLGRLIAAPIRRYTRLEWRLGRDPNPFFDSGWYRKAHPVVDTMRIAPVIHYARYGWREGVNPCPLFDTAWYAERHPDWAGSSPNPLAHFLWIGAKRGFDPSPHFDTQRYRNTYPETATHGFGPFGHFMEYGRFEGREAWPIGGIVEAV